MLSIKVHILYSLYEKIIGCDSVNREGVTEGKAGGDDL